jgi:flagellar hook-basal body complex protein FliE
VGTAGPSFGDLVKTGLGNVAATLQTSEATSAAAVAGTADLNDVVQAVTKAEIMVQTIVAIRDRLIGAYQDILRMPI